MIIKGRTPEPEAVTGTDYLGLAIWLSVMGMEFPAPPPPRGAFRLSSEQQEGAGGRHGKTIAAKALEHSKGIRLPAAGGKTKWGHGG